MRVTEPLVSSLQQGRSSMPISVHTGNLVEVISKFEFVTLLTQWGPKGTPARRSEESPSPVYQEGIPRSLQDRRRPGALWARNDIFEIRYRYSEGSLLEAQGGTEGSDQGTLCDKVKLPLMLAWKAARYGCPHCYLLAM
jgi:hypothetical protein